MKDAINYFIPILKDPMNDITGRCMTNNGLDNTYCGMYHPTAVSHPPGNTPYPDVHMETNSIEIQYNNMIEMDDDFAESRPTMQYPQQRLQQNRKRTNYNCDIVCLANAKRSRHEDADPPFFLSPDQTAEATSPLTKSQTTQTHQRQPTHNMPDMPRCMMGHYV